MLRHAFDELQLHRLEAQISPENQASIKLVQRHGFRYEGYSPDLLFINGAWRGHGDGPSPTTCMASFPMLPIQHCLTGDAAGQPGR
ncbi:GNAT family N-acetyltransferase [Nonomuraea cavernae]|uniref:GNAT family N-acetyltransferase n=1 Tax=Nonomuraea cavernae TaxID=2045107 RepID=UPI0033C6912E